MIDIIITPFKIIYLFFTYLIGGVSRNYYYLQRAHYFADLKMYKFAIHDLKIAAKYAEDPNAEAALGWCYSQINILDISLEHYRKAYSKSKDPEIVLGLAYAEYYNGNINEAKTLIERLSLANKSDPKILSGILKFHEETEKWDNQGDK